MSNGIDTQETPVESSQPKRKPTAKKAKAAKKARKPKKAAGKAKAWLANKKAGRRHAETAQRRYADRDHESYRLAGTYRARLRQHPW